jgi:phosphoenolpyruvate carboxykinase (GTP)
MDSLKRDTIFTNVALTDDGDVWWEGMTDTPPAHLIDWQGRDWTPEIAKATGENGKPRPAAHPNSRFTVAVDQQPGAGRSGTTPTAWPSTPSSSAAAAAPRCRWSPKPAPGPKVFTWPPPWAAKPPPPPPASKAWCAATPSPCCPSPATTWPTTLRTGWSMGDKLAQQGAKLPRIYCVNWFRKGADGKFVWPGYGDNMRVLEWMVGRIEGRTGGAENVFGTSPRYEDLHWDGLAFTARAVRQRDRHRPTAWQQELTLHAELFKTLEYHLPAALPATKAQIEAAPGHDLNPT